MPLLFLLFFVATGVVWSALFIRSNELLFAFRTRYPEEAKQKIQYVFEKARHPSKFLYFMSSASAAFLEEKQDIDLLSRRRLVVRLSIAALIFPFLGPAILTVLAFSGALK